CQSRRLPDHEFAFPRGCGAGDWTDQRLRQPAVEPQSACPRPAAGSDHEATGHGRASGLAAGPLGLDGQRLCVGTGPMGADGRPWPALDAWVLVAQRRYLGVATTALDVLTRRAGLERFVFSRDSRPVDVPPRAMALQLFVVGLGAGRL